jgi:hypothetical protein
VEKYLNFKTPSIIQEIELINSNATANDLLGGQVQRCLPENFDALIGNHKMIFEGVKFKDFEIPLTKIKIITILCESRAFIVKTYPHKNVDIHIKSNEKDLYIKGNQLIRDVFANILIKDVNYNQSDLIEVQIRVSRESDKGTSHIRLEFIGNAIGVPD